jgi:hypothetical protein
MLLCVGGRIPVLRSEKGGWQMPLPDYLGSQIAYFLYVAGILAFPLR